MQHKPTQPATRDISSVYEQANTYIQERGVSFQPHFQMRVGDLAFNHAGPDTAKDPPKTNQNR